MNNIGITHSLYRLQYDGRTANLMYNWRVSSSAMRDNRDSIKTLDWMRSLAVI